MNNKELAQDNKREFYEMLNILLKVIICIACNNVKGANILAVFPTPSINTTFTTLIQELSKRGHQITLITANLKFKEREASGNITTIDIYNKLNRYWQTYNNIIILEQNVDVLSEVSLTLDTVNYFFEELLQISEVQKLIEDKHSYFDLLLLDASVIPLLGLLFKAPAILISTIGAVLDNYETVGAPTHPLLYPSVFQRRIYNLTTWEKLSEISTYVRLKLKILSSEKKLEAMLKNRFGLDFPLVNELKRNVYALFLNSNPIWAGNHPVSPDVVFLGQIEQNSKEELSKELRSFLDESKNGVIYVSFGSNIRLSKLSPNKLLRILNVLSKIPYDVLLKWDRDRLPGAPKNIKIYKWLPQSSLLVHPKIKLFITQGGIQSTFEAINAGVPLIAIPIYSDQWYNTDKYINFHNGLQVDLASLTEEKLAGAIHLVISDASYRKSIAELRALMYEPPGSSLKRAIWWTEQVLQPYRIGHLRAPGAHIAWAEYLELDFVFSLVLVVCVVGLILIILVTLIIRYIIKSVDDIKKKMR